MHAGRSAHNFESVTEKRADLEATNSVEMPKDWRTMHMPGLHKPEMHFQRQRQFDDISCARQ
jgi:hypothetical protein